MKRALLAAALAGAASFAGAHDTWFERLPGAPGDLLLALGTGTQFPAYESGIDARYLVHQGCREAAAASGGQPLQPLRNDAASLVLRGSAAAATCWAQLTPFEIELPADKIEVYLRDIHAGAELRATWAAMQQRGLSWKERYTKHARVLLAGPDDAPVPMAMDALLEGSGGTPRVGDTLVFRVLRDGLPLPGLPVELRSDATGVGLWRRTDDSGHVRFPAPLAGHWILRGVDLRLSATSPDRWDSRFLTLAFDVLPRAAAAQNGISLSWNARSTNQMPATATMTSEPPTSTTRR